LLPNPRSGRPLTGVFEVWARVRERAGLPGLRLHDLRHSYASFLVNAGRSLYEVQALLGHAGRHELRLASCSHCGAQWLYLMQANDGLPLTRDDAAALRTAHGTARAALLARWAEDDEQADWRRRKQRARREAEE
jgi:hypothetical protein